MNFSRKGSTLLNALFAFSIYIVITTVILTAYITLGKNNRQLTKQYSEMIYEEIDMDYSRGFGECIEEVLP